MRRGLILLAGVAVAVLAGAGGWWALRPAPSLPPPAGASADGVPPVPSGQQILFLDRIAEADGVLRFRFLAPQLGEGSAAEQASEDLQELCDRYALTNLPDPANPPRQIVISLSEQAIPLGDIRPDVVQVFEAYRIENGGCVWEMF